MYTYTSEFDKRPLTAYGYIKQIGSNKINKPIVSFYSDAIYYIDRNDYSYEGNGFLVSGSENFNPDNFSVNQDYSGYFWIGKEKDSFITLTKHDQTIEETFSFSGKYPQVVSNITYFTGDLRMSCFYLHDDNIYIRSSNDNFTNGYPVITGKNVRKIYAVRNLADAYTGYLGIFCEKSDGKRVMYINNFDLYPPIWNYDNYLFQDFEAETTGVTDGFF